MGVDISVDPELCIGSGDCVRLVPAAFHIDDDTGVSVPLDGVASADIELLMSAARGCPTQAIRVVRDGDVLHDSN